MSRLVFTLVSDGSSDKALMPIIRWVLEQHLSNYAIQGQWADLRGLRLEPKSFANRIEVAIDYYPCDILFVHRDTEKESVQKRSDEIERAIGKVEREIGNVPAVVPTIPVRMLEAWLMSDEYAIRKASGNPNGKTKINIPKLGEVENLPNPKEVLHDLLKAASGLPPKRLKKFNVHTLVHRVSDITENFSALRGLPAFREMEERLTDTLTESGYIEG